VISVQGLTEHARRGLPLTGKLNNMRTTTLGTHGPEVGVIGLGCMGMTFSYDMATRATTTPPSP
jgi:hypothetical protein